MIRRSDELKPKAQIKIDGSQFCVVDAARWENQVETLKKELIRWTCIQVFEQELTIFGLPAYHWDGMRNQYLPVFNTTPIHTERRL